MKSCGVIVEYNPFHNGHLYHLEQARKQTRSEVVVAVMSGNFLQRGEPALIDKWTRAQEAIRGGADVVIELPFAYAVQSADYFAKGGVKLLQALEVDALCFGTDSQEPVDYEHFAELEFAHQQELAELFQTVKNNGMSYPRQMSWVYQTLFSEATVDFSSPNHLLGMSYAKENLRYANPMKLYPIQRKLADHHDREINNKHFASATAIRQQVLNHKMQEIKQVLPDYTYFDLEKQPYVSWADYFPYLKYRILSSEPAELKAIYQMVEGFEYRIKAAILQSQTFNEFVNEIKTKRFTWTRIQRLCLYILGNVSINEIENGQKNPVLRILAFNEQGRSFLQNKKTTSTLPIVANYTKKREMELFLDIKMGNIYQLGHHKIKSQDYYRKPFYDKNIK